MMPRTSLPPTPAASTEILGKDASPSSATEKSFNLPPPAIESHRGNGTSTFHKQPQSVSSPGFSLPPPPTRSRTIIQMKPKPQYSEELSRTSMQQGSKGSNKKTSSTTATAGKKQPSSTSVAGKKIARKTAHSVIERRRRSKMNEEFGTLKAMIPACTDQEMHKLAILQASIDYLRYLENCIENLKDAKNNSSTPLVQPQAPPPCFDADMSKQNDERGEEDDDENEDEDEEDEDATMDDVGEKGTSSSIASKACAYTSPQSITASPAMEAQSQYQHSSYASSVSTVPSPAFGPQQSGQQSSQSQFSLSASTSPTIMPSREQDQEATAALLMLNKDRRNPKGGRAMSVRDLLSH